MQLLAWGAAVSLEPGRQDAVGRGRTEGGFSEIRSVFLLLSEK